MKTNNLTLSGIAFLLFAILSATTAFSGPVKSAAAEDKAPAKFQNQLAEVYQSYLELKDALVASSTKEASSAAKEASEELKNVDTELLKGLEREEWEKREKKIKANLTIIEKSNSLEAQRQAFEGLSDAFIKSIKEFGVADAKAYKQYCPMALGGKGAAWISDNKEIRNPYFGDKMLKCGSVKGEIN